MVFVMVFDSKTHAKNEFITLFTRWTMSIANNIWYLTAPQNPFFTDL